MTTGELTSTSDKALFYKRIISVDQAVFYLPKEHPEAARHGYLMVTDKIDMAPSVLTLEESWTNFKNYPGIYLFFPDLPDSKDAKEKFINKVLKELFVNNNPQTKQKNMLRFAWYRDLETDVSRYDILNVELSDDNKYGTTKRPHTITISTFKLNLEQGTEVRLNNHGLIFSLKEGENNFEIGVGVAIEKDVELMLADGHAQQGCFRFNVSLNGTQLDELKAGFSYFWKNLYIHFLLFERNTKESNWHFKVALDPINPLNSETAVTQASTNYATLRTGLVFSSGEKVAALSSYLRTRFGKPITLTPAAEQKDSHPAMLVFSQLVEKGNFYLVPQGDFNLNVQGETTNLHHLLCGLSGTETISFNQGDIIRFHPRSPAFSPTFPIIPFDPANASNNKSGRLLKETRTTAWVSIRTQYPNKAGYENFYYSQPQDAPLFKAPDKMETDNSYNRLDIFDAPSANLKNSDASQDCFPLVPVAAAPIWPDYRTADQFLQFEKQILNPMRKQTIDYFTSNDSFVHTHSAQSVSTTAEADIELTTTPQGFLVDFVKDDPEKKWQSIILANDQSSEQPPLRFKKPPNHLQSAFQTNEQFLVISNPIDEKVEKYFRKKFQNQIAIAEWPFILDVIGEESDGNSSEDFSNILIFKFCSHNLVERLKEPALWTQPDKFNDKTKLNKLAEWISKYIEKIDPEKDSVQDQNERTLVRQAYKDFWDKVNDENWNGILALQVTIPIGDMPEAIKGIAAGIDKNRFAAHHIGINSNQIKITDGQLDKHFKSSMFGLINYVDTMYEKKLQAQRETGQKLRSVSLPQVPGDYDFKVLQLQVLFKHSAIADFNCKIQLSMNSLFHEPVTNEGTYYVIRETDSIGKILEEKGLFVDKDVPVRDGVLDELLDRNGHRAIFVKSKVINIDAEQYGLEDGDTLNTIAEKFSLDKSQAIGLLNDIKDKTDILQPGKRLLLPAIEVLAINKHSVVLDGLYDKHDGSTSYTFRQLAENTLELHSTALRSVNIHSVELSTLNSDESAEDTDGRITTRFALSGNIAMQALQDVDILSYDNISFFSLYIDMSFDEQSKQFTFKPAEMQLEPSESKLRDGSLVQHFPITLESIEHFSPIPGASKDSGLTDMTPSSLGYQRVEAPLNYNAIKSTWYGLQFNLSLGTMGALAAKAGFDAKLLISWSPGIKSRAVEVWIKTPFSGGGGKQFSLQGVLKLVTESIRLEKDPKQSQYAMLFTNIKVSLLGLKFPRSGNTLLYLFGDPTPTKKETGDASDTGNLAWFGAYKREKTEQEEKPNNNAALSGETNATLLPHQPD